MAPVPVIRMFGVTDAGNSVLLLVHGFTPYLYVHAPDGFTVDDCEKFRLELNENMKRAAKGATKHMNNKDYILEVTVEQKQSIMGYHGNAMEPFLRICTSLPKQVPVARGILEAGMCWHGTPMRTYESDILFALRFMIDTNLVGCSWVRVEAGRYRPVPLCSRLSSCQLEAIVSVPDLQSLGVENEWSRIAPYRILSFDIECAGKKGCFPDAKSDPVIQIANLVTVYGDSKPIVRNVFTLHETSPIVGAEVLCFDNEKELLAAWKDFILQTDPDVLIGYNIVNFDIPYLLDRARALSLQGGTKWTRIKNSAIAVRDGTFSSRAYGTRESKEISVDGRVLFDILQVAQRDYKLRSFTLNFVSATFLNEQKEEVHHSNITELFQGSPEDRRRLAVYCLKDAYLPQRLMEKLMCFINYVEMARVTGVPFGYLLPRGQQVKVLSQLYRKANREGLVIPFAKKTESQGKYEGAVIMKPIRGFHDTPIVTLDFSSLYPSIMMSHNLCYSTLVGSKQAAAKLQLPLDQCEETPAGDVFVKASVKQGVLPRILQDLIAARKQVKQMLVKETDPVRRAVYDGRQLALKITANSVYGFTGAQQGKLPCMPIASGVTAYGRQMIELTKRLVEEKYQTKNGFPGDAVVIYGDTDSVMVKFHMPDLAKSMGLGKEAATWVTSHFPPPISLEFEKVYYPYLLISKKRYAGLLWTDPNKPGKIDTKGLETVRRDNCPLVKHVISSCLDKILVQRDMPAAIEFTKGIISNLLQNKLDLSLLVISKALSKQGGEYANKQAHVELARKLRERDSSTAPGIGDRVPYVIVSSTKGARAYEKSEDPLYALEKNLPLDYDYYIDQQLKKPILRVFKPILPDPSILFKGEHTRTRIITTPTADVGGIMGFTKKLTICLGCKGAVTGDGSQPLCDNCMDQAASLYCREVKVVGELEQKFCRVWTQCQHCMESMHLPILCTNRDCPIFYMRVKVRKDLQEAQDTLSKFDACW
eukprot:TRINITY_DN4697_c0_g1_i1.p1 TRINITY_DN4697_c0_g1~~TRINITY_DN4697_c0_g1_i1.p1  ORF type:complete len:1087 (-),score=272.85 TRINITY_DN4697_c0_g1_i1:125-3088(-)